MSKDIRDFQEKFKTEQLKLYESEYWIWSLRPEQATLGASILSLKRECSEFGLLSKAEFADLANIIPLIEISLKIAFAYDIMNYLMLMMVDKHVHYHVLPRYSSEKYFAERKWQDEGWPGIPHLAISDQDEDSWLEISDKIKEAIAQTGVAD